MDQQQPYGLWPSPISPENLAEEASISDIQWSRDGSRLVWREQVSGRGTLWVQDADAWAPRPLTGALQVRSQAGYGGGDFAAGASIVVFCSGGRLWRTPFHSGAPQPITPPWGEVTSPAVSPDESTIAYVHSHDGVDVVALCAADGKSWPLKIAEGHDFFLDPTWHPDSERLAWVAWDHPNMPWDGTALCLAKLSGNRAGAEIQCVAGSPDGDEAIVQPRFSPDGRWLAYLSDRGGWLRPWILDLESGEKRRLSDRESDFGGPAWFNGIRSHDWLADSTGLICVENRRGVRSLTKIRLDGTADRLEGSGLDELTSFQQLSAHPSGGPTACIVSAPHLSSRSATVGEGHLRVHRCTSPENVPAECCSRPQPMSFPIAKTRSSIRVCHGLYYPPTNPGRRGEGPPPAVIAIHGGPTSQSMVEFKRDIQFLTTRGYALLELNYRGSTGYGREYSNALRENWGVTDVEDVVAAAESLGKQGLADPSRIALSGGSAGGFTVLLSLIRWPGRFRAGVCRYGVTDLFGLAAETHKFEAHYLDRLVGPLPEAASRYRQRSPIHLVDKIVDPVAIFQGSDDKVVPQSQSDALAASLDKRGIAHVYEVYAGEGHGFRSSETIRSYFQTLEEFLKRHLVWSGD